MAEITVKTVKLSEIKLNSDNPRQISKKDLARLVQSLKEFPEMLELREVVVDETMTVLGGNMRTVALRKIGEKECTAKIVVGLTPEQKKEFIVKDNGAWGEWDYDLLANTWDDLPLSDWGIKGIPEPECIDCDKCETRETKEDVDYISTAKKNERKDVDVNSYDHYVVGFSGGKDSTATLLWCLDNLPKEKIMLVHYDNGWCFPDELAYVKYCVNKYKLKIILYGFKTRESLMDTAKKKGYPFYGNLWCQIQKQRHIAFFQTQYLKKEYGDNLINVIGIRGGESKRRNDYPSFYYVDSMMVWCPIKDWTDDETIEFIISKDEKITSLYRYMNRTGCVFCPNHSRPIYKYISENLPKDFMDMNYIVAYDMKKRPQYMNQAIKMLFQLNLCREVREQDIQKMHQYKSASFVSMDFMEGVKWDKDCVIDLRDTLPSIKAVF